MINIILTLPDLKVDFGAVQWGYGGLSKGPRDGPRTQTGKNNVCIAQINIHHLVSLQPSFWSSHYKSGLLQFNITWQTWKKQLLTHTWKNEGEIKKNAMQPSRGQPHTLIDRYLAKTNDCSGFQPKLTKLRNSAKFDRAISRIQQQHFRQISKKIIHVISHNRSENLTPKNPVFQAARHEAVVYKQNPPKYLRQHALYTQLIAFTFFLQRDAKTG